MRTTQARLEAEFVRGFSVALGILSKSFGEPNTARMVMEEAGYDLADFEAAGCQEYDLEEIRKDVATSPRRRARV